MDEIEELQKTLATNVEPPQESATFIFERWEILDRVGEGGMGVVYKARHQVMKKVGAIKMLHPHLVSHGLTLQRFQQEARAASSLQHPNVIAVQDCGVTDDGSAFLIMEYVEGVSLSSVIRGGGKLNGKRAAGIFVQACRGLQHAHSRGIIHRDLKPSNIMLVRGADGVEEVVKVVDFGIAKVIAQESDEDGKTEVQGLTRSGEIFGSPLYMSPEQCLGQKVDARTDIYSMGCLMYEALAGEPPFLGESALDTMQRHLTMVPRALCDSVECDGDELMRHLDDVVQKCLSKDVEDRYQSMADLQSDIELALSDCTDRDWRSRSHARKDLTARNRKLAGLPKVSIDFARKMTLRAGVVWGGLGLIVGTAVVGLLALNAYMEPVNKMTSRDFDRLFIRTDELPVGREPPAFDEKEKELRFALRVAEKGGEVDSADYAKLLQRHAIVLMAGGKYAQALNELTHAKEVYLDKLQRQESDMDVSIARLLIADCNFYMQEKDRARDEYMKLLPSLTTDSTKGIAIKHYRFLAHLDLEEGDDKGALKAFQHILVLSDSYKNNNQSGELAIQQESEFFNDAVEAALQAGDLRYKLSSKDEGHYGISMFRGVTKACLQDSQKNCKYLAIARAGHGRALKKLGREKGRDSNADMNESVAYAIRYDGADAALLRACIYKTYADFIESEKPIESWLLRFRARQALNQVSSRDLRADR